MPAGFRGPGIIFKNLSTLTYGQEESKEWGDVKYKVGEI